ncbi:MAG: hypothetical protein WCG73_02770 [Candidatus Moraniibacteriota bacterium]
MKNLTRYITERLIHFKKNGVLVVLYALIVEALFIGYLAFATLFTLEMILPFFISAHLSLTKFFFALFLASFVLTLLGRILDLNFQWNINKKNPLLWIAFLWTVSIFGLSLFNFPPFIIPLIIIAFLFVGFLFWKIFFGE